MGSSEIRAGKAAVEVSAKDKMSGALSRISARFKGFAGGISAIGHKLASDKVALGSVISEAVTVASISGAVKAYASAGSQLKILSDRTGLSVEELSKLKYASGLVGANLEDVEVGLRGMDKFMGKVNDGSEETAATLQKLGLSAAQLKGLSPDQTFEKLAKAVGQVGDPTERAALAMRVFGRGGLSIVPLLSNFEKLGAEAESFGAVMSGKSAEDADHFENSLYRLGAASKGVFTAIGSIFVKDLDHLAQRITNLVVNVRDWIRENKDLVGSILRIATLTAAIGSGIVGAGLAVSVAGIAFGGLASVAGLVGSGLTVVLAIVGGLLSPVGLVAAAVLGLAGYLLYTSDATGTAVDFMKDAWSTLADDAKGAFGAISNAMAAGDLAAAVQVLWALLKLEWTKGTNWLDQQWNAFTRFFVDAWGTAIYAVASVFTSAWAGVQSVWDNFVVGILAAWEIVSNGISTSWSWLEKSISKGINYIGNLFNVLLSFWDTFVDGAANSWEWLKGVLVKGLNIIAGLFGFDAETANKTIDENFAASKAKREKEKPNRTGALDDANKRIDAEYDAKSKAAAKDHQDHLAAIGQGNLDRKKKIDKENAARQAALARAHEAEQRARDAQARGDVTAAKKALAEAEAAFADAKSHANSLTPKDWWGKDKKDEDKRPDEDAIVAKGKSSGTFSAAAAARFGGNDTLAARTANATEESRDHLSEIKKNLRAGLGASFS